MNSVTEKSIVIPTDHMSNIFGQFDENKIQLGEASDTLPLFFL